ncbi:D-arabinono-1,4-lactone oxidase-domain-containing protein [Cantharellus anzutake]|uniref:D-arabinono-1,4-lactone oxidase-domain-containing protein n=1 Tax=Cantharellus anzutake TaxID=1750568 RepID=UPI001903D527|nr:D-arabinono-1,4-lactone oxidase-domain-containing protein [Cantharellus anzutake]KAF8331938.1 D-arabinono-1,4-lactone oxidase-domain-containing protein [Cantharellus anzutake]
MIRMDKLDKVIEVDPSNCTITAQPGISLTSVHAHLSRYDLAMSNVGSISEQSLGGCVSSGTHGSGISFGSVASQVLDVDVILASGKKVRCKKGELKGENNERLFMATLCGLGTTGVVVRVTLKVEKAFRLREVRELISFEAFEGVTVAAKDVNGVANGNGIGNGVSHAHGEVKKGGLEEVMASAEHVRIWWYPQSNRVCLSRSNRTYDPLPLPLPPSSSFTWLHSLSPRTLSRVLETWFWDTFLGHSVLQFSYFVGRHFPEVNYYAGLFYSSEAFFRRSLGVGLKAILTIGIGSLWRWRWRPGKSVSSSRSSPFTHPRTNGITNGHTIKTDSDHHRDHIHPSPTHPTITLFDVSHKIFNVDCLFPQYTIEYSIPLSNATSCLRDVKKWLDEEHSKKGGLRPHFPIEVRCSEAEDIWLSPGFGRENCWIGIIVYKPYALPMEHAQLFAHFSFIMRSHGGRPHWAKTHDFSPVDLHQLYPMFGEFLNVVKEVDPEGMFRNEYVKRHLYGEGGEGEKDAVGLEVFRKDV